MNKQTLRDKQSLVDLAFDARTGITQATEDQRLPFPSESALVKFFNHENR